MRLEPLPTEQSALDAAQDRSFAAMRDAIAASETCTAYTRVVDALRPDRIDEIEVLDRARLAAWGADAVAPNSITTGDVRIVLRSSGSSGSIRTVRHSAGFNDQVGFLGARGIGMGGLPRNPWSSTRSLPATSSADSASPRTPWPAEARRCCRREARWIPMRSPT